MTPDVSTTSAEERRRRWREGAIIAAAGAAVMFFAYWEFSNPGPGGGSQNVVSFLLINLNIVLLLVVAFLVVRNVMKLVLERRRGVLGSQLRSRMVMAFVSIALFPAALMLLVSTVFFTNSIDNWFSSEVEQALSGAYNLARTYYSDSADTASRSAKELALSLRKAGLNRPGAAARAEAVLRDREGHARIASVRVFNSSGEAVLTSVGGADLLEAGPPARALVERALAGQAAVEIEHVGDEDLLRGVAPVLGADANTVVGVVVVDYLLRAGPRRWSEDILSSFRDYRQLKLNRKPFKSLYTLTMVLASLVVVFAATWLGLNLARGITEPIGRLAEATREVAEGNWEAEVPEAGGDEMGTLVRGFRSMTAQLKAGHDALDERARYTENILRHVDAGVVSVDVDGLVATVNPAAVSLLGLSDVAPPGRDAVSLLGEAGYDTVIELLEDVRSGTLPSGSSRNVDREEEGRTLLVTATELRRRSGEKAGSVLFFEDVSQIAAAERMEAWREVARRVAHEVKNPLTPISLSAQRLSRRVGAGLPPEERAILEECTGTIVTQVEQLKAMVNQFSSFARQSDSVKLRHFLNPLVEETMPLYVQSRPDLDVEFYRGDDLPALMMDREAVKRALINLLDNAVYAADSAVGDRGEGRGRVEVRTSYDEKLQRAVLEVIDNGPGIPAGMRARVFDPFYSTKEDGSGLGLAMVASMAADHQAYFGVVDNSPTGSRFKIEFPVDRK